MSAISDRRPEMAAVNHGGGPLPVVETVAEVPPLLFSDGPCEVWFGPKLAAASSPAWGSLRARVVGRRPDDMVARTWERKEG